MKTKKNLRKDLDYWMLEALKDAVNFVDNKYPAIMVAEQMGRARQTLLIAAGLEIVNNEEFGNINHCLSYSSLATYR